MYKERIQQALQVFGNPLFDPKQPAWSLIANLPKDVVLRLLDSVLTSGMPFVSEQVVDAFRAGELAYQLIPNIMPVTLLTMSLPIVDPANTSAYLQEAERALDILKLNLSWYWCVEHHQVLTDDSLNFYSQMSQSLLSTLKEVRERARRSDFRRDMADRLTHRCTRRPTAPSAGEGMIVGGKVRDLGEVAPRGGGKSELP